MTTRGNVAVAAFEDGKEIEADVIIGADGIRSNVRESLFGASPARYTEQMAWRAIVPIEYVPQYVGPNKSVRISPEDYVGWIGPTGHVICYPIRGGELYNLFIGHVSEEWQEESWTAPSTKQEMFAAHAGWNDALLGMFEKTEETYKWGIYDREPLSRWTQGRVTLLGDAAHPMMPTLAQGASITMEDAYTVARNARASRDDPERGLKSYEAERIDRARRVQLQARAAVPEQPEESGAAAVVARLDIRARRHRGACAGVVDRAGSFHLRAGGFDHLFPA